MARRASPQSIHKFLRELGLGANPIEKITHHEDGAVTIWLTSLAEPVRMDAPAPKTRRKSQPAKPTS